MQTSLTSFMRYPDEIVKGSLGVDQKTVNLLRNTDDPNSRRIPASPTLAIHSINDRDTCLYKCGYKIVNGRLDPSYPFYPIPSKACQVHHCSSCSFISAP